MKAKDLVKILQENPEMEVVIQSLTGAISPVTFVGITETNELGLIAEGPQRPFLKTGSDETRYMEWVPLAYSKVENYRGQSLNYKGK